jgi:hypothetical protein
MLWQRGCRLVREGNVYVLCIMVGDMLSLDLSVGSLLRSRLFEDDDNAELGHEAVRFLLGPDAVRCIEL